MRETTAMTESNIEKVGAQPTTRPGPKRAPRARSASKGVPDGVKRPADHQPAKNDAQDEVKPALVTWGTKAGEPDDDGNPTERVPAVYKIDPLVFDDIEFVEAMIDMDEAPSDGERSVYAYKALRTMLGPEQLAEYKKSGRESETGRASFSDSIAFFNHITKELKQGNS